MVRLKIPIKGIPYRVGADMWDEMVRTSPFKLRLEREPDNLQDPNAIKVVGDEKPWKDFHIGYIPREYAPGLAARLDKGRITVEEAYLQDANPIAFEAVIELKTAKTSQKRKPKPKT